MALPHHTAWLAAHPHRTATWLRERIIDGFDIHHLDGDHGNNDPSNLVLIEHTDHMMLHGGRTMGRISNFLGKKGGRKKGITAQVEGRGAKLYHEKAKTGHTWEAIGKRHGLPGGRTAMATAKAYAIQHRAPWPIKASST